MTETKIPYHHGDLKPALIAAGIALLENDGLSGLSLRGIAAQVGVSHSAPKNHFGSLRGLLTAIAAEGFRRHAAFMREGVEDVGDPQARLHAAMQGYVRFARQHPHLFELMFSPRHCDHDDADLRAAGRDSYAVLAGIAKGLDWDKATAPGGQRRSEMMLWSLVHGYAKLQLAGLFDDGPGGAGSSFSISDIMPGFSYRAAEVG